MCRKLKGIGLATGQRGDRLPGPTRGLRQLRTARSQFYFRGPFAGAQSAAAAESPRPRRRDAMASMPLRRIGAALPTCKRALPGSRRIRLSAIPRMRGQRCQLQPLPQRMQERREQRRRLIRDASVFAAAMPGRAGVADQKHLAVALSLGGPGARQAVRSIRVARPRPQDASSLRPQTAAPTAKAGVWFETNRQTPEPPSRQPIEASLASTPNAFRFPLG